MILALQSARPLVNCYLYVVLLLQLLQLQSFRFEKSVVRVVCSDFCQSAEDMELIEQMNALGLPVSFLTNKEVCSYSKCFGTSYSLLKTLWQDNDDLLFSNNILLIKNFALSSLCFFGWHRGICYSHGRCLRL